MLFLLVPLHNLTDLNRLLSNNIATALYLGKSNYILVLYLSSIHSNTDLE